MGNNLIYMRRRLGIMAQPHRETQTGDIVTFTGIKAPLSVLAQIVPVQSGSGDPSPSNVRPITGWTGCEVTRTGVNIFGGTVLRDAVLASFSNSGEVTEGYVYFSANSTESQKMTKDVKFAENTQYTFIFTIYKSTGTNSNLRVYYTDGTYDAIPSVSEAKKTETVILVSQTGKTVKNISKVNSSGVTSIVYNETGIFKGVLTLQDFLAYTGQTVSVDWQSTAGTVYGGSLQINTDGTGVLTATRKIVTPSIWNMAAATSCFYIDGQATDGTASEVLCNMYPWGAVVTGAAYTQNYPRRMCVQSFNGIRFAVYDPTFTTADAFNTFISNNPIQIVYPLATPVTYTLTAEQVGKLLALNGVNNIWSNTGEISVEYWKH